MKLPEDEVLVIKYLTNTSNIEELDRLSKWLEDPENEKLFEEYVRINYSMDYHMNEYNSENTKKVLLNKIRKERKTSQRNKVISLVKYAAVFVCVLGLAYFFKSQGFFNKEELKIKIMDKNAITLELDNGNVRTISTNGVENVFDKNGNVIGVQKGKGIVYKSGKVAGKVSYNLLKVPYGKKFQLVLSDSTHVHLNSGSSLKYPVSFIEGESRKVFLLEGEALFDVTKSKSAPFIVNMDKLNIEVLGTQFNASFYSEDSSISTVLVEGSVALYEEERQTNEQLLLKPSYKADWDKRKKVMSVEKVDTSIYTAWTKGELLFKNAKFNTIRRKLERHFNVSISNEYHYLDNRVFNASFYGENIEDVLNAFIVDTPFEYKVVEKDKIIIVKPNNN